MLNDIEADYLLTLTTTLMIPKMVMQPKAVKVVPHRQAKRYHHDTPVPDVLKVVVAV